MLTRDGFRMRNQSYLVAAVTSLDIFVQWATAY